MTYYSRSEQELSRSGAREGDLAIYTGTVNPRQPRGLSPGVESKNAYLYLWQDGWPRELDACFQKDWDGLEVLKAETGEETYTFLRDQPSGYIRQLSGPARPIIVGNIGALPLRVDSLTGKYIVHAGTILRLDEYAPRRERKQVLLTLGSCYDRPIESAEVWDGTAWRRLNICEEELSPEGRRSLVVRDGGAIVQTVTVIRGRELLLPDPPEPEPDHDVFISGKPGGPAVLAFDRSDYRGGKVVRRTRRIASARRGEAPVYDLRKLRDSPTQEAAYQCTAELPEREPLLLPELPEDFPE